jgi:hypothetical protein
MARMGQPLLPQMMNTTSPQQPAGVIYGVEDDDWVGILIIYLIFTTFWLA